MDIILFLAGIFLMIFIIGKYLEKIKIPGIFSALLIGLGLSAYNPFQEITSSASFVLLSNLGMYFLLFIIGFELNIKEILSQGNFIFKMTFAVISVETIFGTLLIHYIFSIPWIISIVVSASFATVGEAILLPILDEFKLIKTKLGQTILGVGVLDDFIEILTIIATTILIGQKIGQTNTNIANNLITLGLLFGLTFILIKFSSFLKHIEGKNKTSLFLFVIFFLFLFIGIGNYGGSDALGALLAGIALKNAIPKKTLKIIDSEIRTVAYGLFAPIFFLSVGLNTDINYIIKYPLLIILFMVMIKIAKIATSYFMGRNVLGPKKSIVLGIGLCVKFSTSIVILTLLLNKGLIQTDLFSVLIGTTIAFKFFVPVLMSYFIKKWKVNLPNKV